MFGGGRRGQLAYHPLVFRRGVGGCCVVYWVLDTIGGIFGGFVMRVCVDAHRAPSGS